MIARRVMCNNIRRAILLRVVALRGIALNIDPQLRDGAE